MFHDFLVVTELFHTSQSNQCRTGQKFSGNTPYQWKMLFCWIQTILSEMPYKLPTHCSGSVTMDSKSGWESSFLQTFLAKLGFQALCREAQDQGKQAFVNVWLHFVIKRTFGKRVWMHHISQFDIFHNRELTRFALAFGVNTGAGLLKGGGILYFSQP